MATKKCGCRRCGQAQWSLWQNHSMTKHCWRVFGPLWRVELTNRSVQRGGKEVFVGAVATFGSVGQDRNPRRFEQIIGNSAALESVLEQVEQVAPTNSTVLIEGETGTGKELIAHAIHNASQRCG